MSSSEELKQPSWDARFAELAELPPGWFDGEGTAIDEVAMKAARALLAVLADSSIALPRIYPTVDGGIQLEWHGPDGFEVVLPAFAKHREVS